MTRSATRSGRRARVSLSRETRSPRARLRLWALAGAGGLIAVIGIVVLSRDADRGVPASDRAAEAAARDFLTRYVHANGRVVRRDQGGDTVSEGTSYALLLAQVADEPGIFARVWTWAREHLFRPDGLLSNRSEGDAVRDPEPASDADVVTAWALARADGPRASAYHAAAGRMGAAVLKHETTDRAGQTILAAGPWATGSPATVNPSYWAFPAFEGLAETSAGSSWRRVADSSLALARSLTSEGEALPPDWARIDGDSASPSPDPNGAVPQVQYGPDAQRLVVWLAASCDAGARRLAAAWWPLLSAPGRSSALALSAQGAVVNGTATPLALVSTAAAAGAAGHAAERDRLLDRATRLDAAHPTYYGAAWVALGRALLTTRSLGTCAQVSAS